MAGILASSQPLINAAFNNQDDSMRAIPKKMTGQGIGSLRDVPIIVGQAMPSAEMQQDPQMQQASEPQPMSPTPNFDAMNNLPQQNFILGGLLKAGIQTAARRAGNILNPTRNKLRSSIQQGIKRKKASEKSGPDFFVDPKGTVTRDISPPNFKDVLSKTTKDLASLGIIRRNPVRSAIGGLGGLTLYNYVTGSGDEGLEEGQAEAIQQLITTPNAVSTTDAVSPTDQQNRLKEIERLMVLAGIADRGPGARAARAKAEALKIQETAARSDEKDRLARAEKVASDYNAILLGLQEDDMGETPLSQLKQQATSIIQSTYGSIPGYLTGTGFEVAPQTSANQAVNQLRTMSPEDLKIVALNNLRAGMPVSDILQKIDFVGTLRTDLSEADKKSIQNALKKEQKRLELSKEATKGEVTERDVT